MKIKCLHGFFQFEEVKAGEVSAFISLTGLEIEPRENYFTFPLLVDAPDFSLVGKSLLGLPAVATFAGKPWEVFEANGFVFDFTVGLMKPIAAVTIATKVSASGNVYTSPGLIQPGSITAGGRVKDFAGWWSRESLKWVYSEVSYV